jgi:hypothetical protein
MMKGLIIIGTIHSMVTGDQDRNESEYLAEHDPRNEGPLRPLSRLIKQRLK